MMVDYKQLRKEQFRDIAALNAAAKKSMTNFTNENQTMKVILTRKTDLATTGGDNEGFSISKTNSHVLHKNRFSMRNEPSLSPITYTLDQQ
jgi:hypothetical protein